MNYALYLQNGGSAEPRQFSEEEIAMIKTLQPYGEAFKQSPGGAIEMAARELNFNLDSPAEIREFLTGLDAYARLIDDVDLINDIQKFGQESNLVAEEPMFKCGGRVRAKVKKACGGKKLEKGAKVPVEKKGGCPCQYRRVGGRIQLVDCNGIPIAKNGTVLKARLGETMPQINTTLDINPNLLGGGNYRSLYLWGNGGARTTVNRPQPVISLSKLDGYQNLTGEEAYRLMHGTHPSIIENERAAAAEEARLQAEEEKRMRAAEAAKQSATLKTAGQLMFERGLASGTLSDYSLQGRQNWVNSEKNRAYLDAMGWDAARRAAYKGSAADNKELLKLILGRAGWLPALPQMSAGEKFVSEGYASGRPWQDAELQNMDADQAIHLNTPDYNRWMQLNFNLTLAKPYVTPASPVLNPNATRKDIYNFSTARTPFAQVNPVVARKDGGKMSYADYLK